jgi:hypothetical protein
MSGTNGFRFYDIGYLLKLPIRRLYRADWFQPVARIGAEGGVELLLKEIDELPADELPRPRNPTDPNNKATYPIRVEDTDEFSDTDGELRRRWSHFGYFEPIPEAARRAAREVWRKQGLASRMVADFVAPESGAFFLYVNDAIQVVPFVGAFDRFYKDNDGTAKVTLQRIPLPPAGD